MPDRPNILLILTDEHRGDCVGLDPNCPTDGAGRPLVHTPHLDYLADDGALFSRAYSPAPTCVPARRCLWTGQRPVSCDATGWTDTPWEFDASLPAELTDAGYQTRLVGKSHSYPLRKHFGFEHMELHTGTPLWEKSDRDDDYTRWLEERIGTVTTEYGSGLTYNTSDARPWHLPEELHPSHWTTNRAREFIETRDPTRPFFLTVSYVRPHPQYDPPRAYWEQYIDRDLPDPAVGDWVDDVYGGLHDDRRPTYATTKRGTSPDFWAYDAPPETVHRIRAAYYALVSHIDHQIRRLIRSLEVNGLFENTLVCFTADHGEMLGDHHLWLKSYGYDPSARVPFLLRFPNSLGFARGRRIDRLVGLEDVMPTLLDVADARTPGSVEGRSLLDLLEDPDREDWRSTYHGEHDAVYHPDNATQYLVAEGMKYIWNPATGDQLLFDLEADPDETTNLVGDPEYGSVHATLRDRLIERLADRPEGFTDGDELVAKRRASFIFDA